MRGLLLRAAATAARSSAPCTLRSVPFGKYCRNSPSVFSFVPRCHGERGSQKYTRKPVSIRSRACCVISAPWSQVSDRRSARGKVMMARPIASRTASAPCPANAGPFFSRTSLPWPSMADSRAKRNGLSEADLHIFAKLFEQGLERGEEAEALARREIVAEHDLLRLGVAQRVEVEVARQVAPQPPVGVLHRPFLPGRVSVA